MQALSVSIVIPVYNAESTLKPLLDSLLRLDYPKELLEIAIVDNNSTDSTPELLRQYPFKVIKEYRKGAYIARNTGIATTQCDIVAFTDADCVVESDWLHELLAGFSEPQIGICGGDLLMTQPRTSVERYISQKRIMDQEKAFSADNLSPPFFMTANIAVRRELFEHLGGFDEFFIISGDADFCWRAGFAGYKLNYRPEAKVYHHHRSDVYNFYKQRFQWGYGTTTLFKKHRQRFGRKYWFAWREYQALYLTLLEYARMRITGREDSSTEILIYDIISSCGFLAGRLFGSLRNRVLVV